LWAKPRFGAAWAPPPPLSPAWNRAAARAEYQNDDYEADETTAVHRRNVATSTEPLSRATRVARPRFVAVAAPARKKAISFRRWSAGELKDLVVTNRMLSHPHEQPEPVVEKYGVAASSVNERALGKVIPSPRPATLSLIELSRVHSA